MAKTDGGTVHKEILIDAKLILERGQETELAWRIPLRKRRSCTEL
jgi:hypothetical protein